MMINPDKLPYTSKDKFLSNGKNKTELVNFLADLLRAENIGAICCSDDADTSIVQCIIDQATHNIVEVRAEDNDILIMLIHHVTRTHNSVLLTTSKGSYNVIEIAESLTELQRFAILLIHAFTVGRIAGERERKEVSRRKRRTGIYTKSSETKPYLTGALS